MIACTHNHARRGPVSRVAVMLSLCAFTTLGPSGCAHAPKASELRGADYVIRKVHFEGNERFDKKELHDYLEMRPREWIPPRRYWFYEGLLPVDAQRIVELYHAHGYYEAKVIDVRVEKLDRPSREKVDLTYVIEEGPVTRVEQIEVRWPEGPPPGPPGSERSGPFVEAPTLEPERIEDKRIELAEGEPFEVEALTRSAAALREHLRDAGHPYAEVSEHARVNRARRSATVEFVVRPGPYMTIGGISIEGLDTVPEKELRVELESAIGERYSPALLEQLEQSAYGMRVFSRVTVELARDQATPAERSAGVGEVGLEIEVRESDPQHVRLGFSLGFEPNRWDQRVSARYSHNNLFHELYRLRLTGRAGYAELPNLINPVAHGPVALVDLQLQKKGLLEKHLVWTLDPRFELGIEQGYQFWSVQHRFGLSRFFTRWFQLRASHTLRYVNFFSVSPNLRVDQTFLDLDFRDPYVISYVDVGATLFAIDRIPGPNDGAVIGLEYRIAGGPFGGGYDFHELSPILRAYWRPIDRLQLAARARVGMIFPFGDQPGAPIDLRRYLGGADTVRGWGLRRLAPRIDDCEPGEDPAAGECESIPVGGNTSVLGNFEVRVRTWRGLWIAAFVDGGDVQPGVTEFDPSQWNYSAGGGLRYDSPLGKFRLDVGFRRNDTTLSEGEPIWAIHLGLGESF